MIGNLRHCLPTRASRAMPIIPDIAELRSTIERMEARYKASKDPQAGPLMEAYGRVAVRYESQLADERDRFLSKASALMMVRFVLEPEAR